MLMNILLFLSTITPVLSLNYDNCDSSAVLASTKATSLAPNQFHKVCPGVGSENGAFSYPQCGDGTPFAFFFHKPPKRKMNSDKLLIEFMGGGACWDANSCGRQASYLTFPENLDKFIGRSCTEIEYGANNGRNLGGGGVNMLCAQTVGGVDFTGYNTIVVPYCTQDVHVGSNTITYEDGSTVNHVGAANMMSVMKWVYNNFPNPKHIVLTGCSAGGTALPIAYDLLYMHYNRWTRSPPGIRSVQINTIVDSAVYLTPKYFLKNGIDNWNPSPMMKKMNFPYNKYRYNEDYSTRVWNHALHRGSKHDLWGFVTHNDDPVSEFYYKAMGGYLNEDDDFDYNEDDDVAEEWWTSLSYSLESVSKKHKNFDTFVMDGQGHCTFGLSYAIDEDGFDDWATEIFEEKAKIWRASASLPLFFVAVLLGSIITFGIVRGQRKRRIEVDDGVLLPHEKLSARNRMVQSVDGVLGKFLKRYEAYPASAGLIFVYTFYFLTMLLSGGFTHPIDNPSLGPSAETLSSFGINNPTMVIYGYNLFRLFTSGFLCSGVITYIIVLSTLLRQTRQIEQALGNTKQFILISLAILFGSNLIYACLAEGASCASISIVVGLNVMSIILSKRVESSPPFPRPICSTITTIIIVSFLFPFNSWLNILGGVLVGGIFGFMLHKDEHTEQKNDSEERYFSTKMMPLRTLILSYIVMFCVLIFQLRKPDQLYMSPFLTGCDLVYSDVPDELLDSFYRKRKLRILDEDFDAEYCVEFCIPHLVARPLAWGVTKFSDDFSVKHGQCEDIGYSTHIADKTFTKATYSIDVEVYSVDGNN